LNFFLYKIESIFEIREEMRYFIYATIKVMIFMVMIFQRVEAQEMERKHLRGKETKVILSDSNLSLRGSNIMIEGMTNHGEVEYHQEYPFDSLILYDFILKDSKKINLQFQAEEENNILEEEQISGYDAYECYDKKDYRYVYYISHNYDLYEFGHHILKKYFQQKPIVVFTFYVIQDIKEV
jgi:hypothetical protein